MTRSLYKTRWCRDYLLPDYGTSILNYIAYQCAWIEWIIGCHIVIILIFRFYRCCNRRDKVTLTYMYISLPTYRLLTKISMALKQGDCAISEAEHAWNSIGRALSGLHWTVTSLPNLLISDAIIVTLRALDWTWLQVITLVCPWHTPEVISRTLISGNRNHFFSIHILFNE